MSTSLTEQGIRKYIIAVGTVDLVRLPDNSSEPAKVAEEDANAVIAMSQLQHPSSSICYIIPVHNHKITEVSYNQFAKHIHQMLSPTTIKVLSAENVMRDSIQPTDNLYDTILQSCLHDSLHWCHALQHG